MSDVLESAFPGTKYETLKTRIIATFSESSERKLKRLLSGQVMGDQKPSQFLRTMQSLGRGQVGDNVLKSLFLEQLPENVRAILSISDQQDINKLADQADKIMDMARPANIASIDRPQGESALKVYQNKLKHWKNGFQLLITVTIIVQGLVHDIDVEVAVAIQATVGITTDLALRLRSA